MADCKFSFSMRFCLGEVSLIDPNTGDVSSPMSESSLHLKYSKKSWPSSMSAFPESTISIG